MPRSPDRAWRMCRKAWRRLISPRVGSSASSRTGAFLTRAITSSTQADGSPRPRLLWFSMRCDIGSWRTSRSGAASRFIHVSLLRAEGKRHHGDELERPHHRRGRGLVFLEMRGFEMRLVAIRVAKYLEHPDAAGLVPFGDAIEDQHAQFGADRGLDLLVDRGPVAFELRGIALDLGDLN